MARVEINCAALQHNFARVKKCAPNAAVMAVIKADAYGHGMELVASTLDNADEFGVRNLADVRRLRNAGFNKHITVLSGVWCTEELALLSKNVALTLFDWTQLEVIEQATLPHRLSVWLKLDTGMGRLGFLKNDLDEVLRRLGAISKVTDIKLMTHLANATNIESEDTQRQLDILHDVLEQHTFDQVSVLNSAGVCSFPSATYQTVRPGLMLYGASPLDDTSAEELQLRPVMTLKSRLISVREMPVGSAIGYGGVSVLCKEAVIGIIACGYGDGYPRHTQVGAPVLIKGKFAPLLGRVSMDMIAVDISDVDAQVGDDAILWGNGNPIELIAEYANTIPYTLMCGITDRVERVTVDR